MTPLLSIGFRPFYLAASLLAALSVGAWVLQYTGALPAGAYLRGFVWHGHEMVFGYAFAVIAGFLLTAVRNWTGQPTPSGLPLALLVLLWLAARVLVLTPYAGAAMWASALFPLALAVAIGVPLFRARNRRNYFFVALLAGAAGATLVVHLGFQDRLFLPARAGLVAGLDVVLFIVSVMGGRVIPMFTNNALPGTGATRKPGLERAALGSVLALLALDVVGAPPAIIALVASAACLAHLARFLLWRPWKTARVPMVWVLHVGYAWVPLHLALRVAAAAGLVGESLAFHALTVGAIGGLTIGMMARTARGHTGRPIVADRWETAAFALVPLAAIVRVFGPLALDGRYLDTVMAAAALWSAAFAIYFLRYWPVLTRARADGRPG